MELVDKIKRLTSEFGVSGDEKRVSAIAAELLREYTDEVQIDEFGNVTGFLSCGVEGAPTLMLDAHIDQIGFIVTGITDGGFLRFMAIGVDQRMLPGSELAVLTREGVIRGVVGTIPAIMQDDPTASIPIGDMTVDIGMTAEEARRVVRVGDYMAFYNPPFELLGNKLCSKALDDRACFVCILHALELLRNKQLKVNLLVCASIKEELGGHGSLYVAYRHKPEFAIAIDVSHAKTQDAPEVVCELGKGPIIDIGYNSRPELFALVKKAADDNNIPYQVTPCPAGSGTNAWSIQLAGKGVGTFVMSLPLKYMHSPVEVLHTEDVRNTGALIAAFAQAFDGRVQL
ncbi:MAG: M42 family peptidase [Clostridia bacterium]|nr:M42 family peptidase [Clostridia bacterium]